MKLFTVKLSDEERKGLEAHRVALGLRSHSEVIRHWIARAYKPESRSNSQSYPLAWGEPMTEEDILDDVHVKRQPFRGVTASGEPLPDRKPYQKMGKK